MRYEVWQEPTERGKTLFSKRLIGTFNSRESADECAYLEDADEPAPDKHDYRAIVVKEIP